MIRKTVILTVIGLALLYWINNNYFQVPKGAVPFSSTINSKDFLSATKLEVNNFNTKTSFSLTHTDNRWIIQKERVNFVVSNEKVENLLRALGALASDSIVSRSAKEWAQYGLDENTGIQLHLFKKGELLDVFVLGFVGQNQFVRFLGSNEVFLLKKSPLGKADLSFLSFREKQLLNFEPATIKALHLYGFDTLVWKKDSTGWDSILTINPDELLLAWSQIEMTDFIDDFDETKEDLMVQQLDLIDNNNRIISLYAYIDSLHRIPYVLHSSTNPESWFQSDSIGIYNEIFGVLRREGERFKLK